MKIAFDTNVLLDAIADRAYADEAKKLIMAAASGSVDGIVTANSVTDIYYIAGKHLGSAGARKAVRSILTLFDVADVCGDDCFAALEAPMADFEDALLVVCSRRAGADYIATRDEKFIASASPVPAKKPEDILELIRQSER